MVPDGPMNGAAARILIVDRDAKYREWVRLHLGILYPQATVGTLDPGEEGTLGALATGRSCEALILGADFGMGGGDPEPEGLQQVRLLQASDAAAVLVVLAQGGDELTAVQAIRAGATDYLPKRLLTPARLKAALDQALKTVEPAPPPEAATVPAAPEVKVASEAEKAPAKRTRQRGPSLSTSHPTIRGYEITRKLSESEKAAVYLAESRSLGTNVALKVSKIPCEDRTKQALEREYQAILAVHDPAVVRIFDHGIEDGYEYLAMEYFPRGDLKARMHVGVTESEALRFLEKIAGALAVVHRAGLLHRDLKPPNVMLRENDNIVLIDFGLARLLDVSHHSTYTGVLRGSPYYMSPEQALGEKLDPRSDLYSLGVIFHEMLTGRKPFMGNSAMEVLQQHVNASPPRLPSTLDGYTELLARLLAKQRENRFGSAEELITACAALRGGSRHQAQSAA